VLPQATYDKLKAACQDILLWKHIDPDAWYGYDPVPDGDYWEHEPFDPDDEFLTEQQRASGD